jgi:hypothetical protein
MYTASDLGRFVAYNAYMQEKTAKEKPYGTPQFGAQQYLPINERREFEPEEQERIEKGKDRWIPRIFQSYATDPAETMASPTKQGLLTGLLGAGAGGIGGLALGGLPGGLIGAGLGGVVGGVGGAWSRQAENESIEELMRRLPPGARMRDIMSDPVFQRDADRTQSDNNSALMLAAMRSMR